MARQVMSAVAGLGRFRAGVTPVCSIDTFYERRTPERKANSTETGVYILFLSETQKIR